ncbi:MAG TPA: hypothetical protein VI336_00035 [Candidatus Saccharimonadales bacterium]|nr:hypothetical protein [Candidatus Saccharimonadales bacterium]
MPPQNDQTSTPSEPANFDFMLKQKPQQKKSFGLPSGLGKPAKLLIAAAVALVIAIAAALIFGGGDSNSKQVFDLMAQNQEIVRVSRLQDQKFTDEDTKGLSATTQAVMSSQKFQLGDYLSKVNVQYSEQQLAAKMNKNTDADLQTAAQNNNLDSAYVSYLKASLTTYMNSLNEAFTATSSQSLKSTLQSAYESVQTLLKSPQLKS